MRPRSKFGIRSGNSFHLGSQLQRIRYASRYIHQVQKVVQTKNTPHPDTEEFQALKSLSDSLICDGSFPYAIFPLGPLFYNSTIIPLSLNKRKRWLLPSLVQNFIEEISEKSLHTDDYCPFKVTLVERMNFSACSSRCDEEAVVSYHDSSMKMLHAMPKKTFGKLYGLQQKANGKATQKKPEKKWRDVKRETTRQNTRGVQRLKETQKKKCSKTRNPLTRFLTIENAALLQENPITEIRYEVTYPAKLNSHRRHMDDSHKIRYQWNWLFNHPRKALKKIKCYGLNKHVSQGKYFLDCAVTQTNDTEQHLLETLEEESFKDEVEDFTEYIYKESEHQVEVFVSELLKVKPKSQRQAKLERTWCRQKKEESDKTNRRRSLKQFGKGTSVIVSDHDVITNSIVWKKDFSSNEDSFEFLENDMDKFSLLDEDLETIDPVESTCCSFITSSVSPEALHEAFGNLYIEGSSLPRKFLVYLAIMNLKTTHQTSHRNQGHKDVLMSMNDGEGGYLLFEQCDPLNDDSCVHMRVRAIGNFDSEFHCELANILRKSDQPVYELFEIFVQIHKLLPDVKSSGITTVAPFILTSSRQSLTFLHSACRWTIEPLDEKDVYNLISRDSEGSVTHSVNQVSLSHSGSHRICEICYDSLGDELGSKSLALKNCGHEFCKNCWKRHIMTAIEEQTMKLNCPAVKCDSPVDDVTLISLVPPTYIRKRTMFIFNNFIDRQPTRWSHCVNPKCNKIIQVDTPSNGSLSAVCVLCSCGYQWCLLCRRRPHWPAECNQANVYDKFREQNNDNTKRKLSVFFVNIKRCPSCRYPIEKNGGCSHMECRMCRKSFCWECHQDYTNHVLEHCIQNRVNEQTIEIDRSMDVKIQQRFYLSAVEQHWKRWRWTMPQLFKKIADLTHTANYYWSKRSKSFDNLLLSKYLLMPSCPPRLSKAKYETNYTINNALQYFEFLWGAAVFHCDVRFFLEYAYVRLMLINNYRKLSKSLRSLRETVERLHFIADRLEELLFETAKRPASIKLEQRIEDFVKYEQLYLNQLVSMFSQLDKKTSHTLIVPIP